MAREDRITSKDVNENEIELVIKTPSASVLREANKVYAAAFREAVESGMLVKRKLKTYLRDQGLWDDTREKEYADLISRIGEAEYKLNTGKDRDGNKIKLSEGRTLSLQLMRDRITLRGLIAEQQEYDSNTAEGYADNERFFYLVAACSFDFLTNKPYFSSLQDYKDRDAESAAVDSANKVASMIFGVEENYEQTLTEFKFLKRFGMVDEDGYLVDKDGNYIDEDGNPIEKLDVSQDNEEPESFNVEEADFEDDLGVYPSGDDSPQESDDADEIEDSSDEDIVFSPDED